jgi:hypothetical protein
MSLFSYDLVRKGHKAYHIEDGMLYIKKEILDGDRCLGVKSLEGYPEVILTHPVTKSDLHSYHLIPKNCELPAKVKSEISEYKKIVSSKKRVKIHPFQSELPPIKDIDHIHYD